MTMIPIHLIEPGTRLRGADAGQVKRLSASIAEVGLLHPIVVYQRKVMHGGILVDGYGVVAGLNRLEAHKSLGRPAIEATVVALDELHRQLAEVDENLAGSKLTTAERALFTRRRKEIYEALHPETKQHVAGGRAKAGSATDNLSFAADTAKNTGVDERTIRRDAARGALGDELAELKGTSLDKGVELDALAKMSAAERQDLIDRAKKGEAVSARSSGAKKRTANAEDKDLAHEAAEKIATLLAEHIPGEEWDGLKANFAATTTKRVLAAFTRHVGVSVFDRTQAGAA
jgi:ParB family transcriptional regulator, chromosome partitioning protein